MTRNQIIERVKALMHLGDRSDLSPTDEALLGDIATAIVDMLGPKELEWEVIDQTWHSVNGRYSIRRADPRFTGGFTLFMFGLWEGFDTLEAAKAAAQAHHEEQHWKRTRIWEDE